MRVAGRLRLDVTGDLDKTLDEVSAQVGSVRVTREEQVEVGLRADDADAASAAAVGALEHRRGAADAMKSSTVGAAR